MQKLKKVFSPGNDRDDELMYGSPASRKSAEMSGTDASPQEQSATSSRNDSTLPGKEHGVTRQVLNPDGAKYDEQRYGKPATESYPKHDTEEEKAALASRMGESKEDTSVKRKVLDPEHNQRDETGYGASSFSDHNTQTKPVVSDFERSTKPNELGSVPPSNDSYESGRTPAAAAALAPGTQSSTPDASSRMSMKSGVVGSEDHSAEERRLELEGITSQDEPAGAHETSSRGYGKEAALAGTGTAAGAGGIYAATRQRRQSRTSGDQDVEDATYTDRSFPLSGGTASQQYSDRPASSTYSNDAAGPRSTSAYIDPATTSSTYVDPATTSTTNSRDAGGIGPGSGSAALAGAGAGAAGSAVAKEKLADHSRHSHDFRGDPCETGEVDPQDKTLPFVPGPHQTLAANVLDPHVPGEFPADDGTDPHGSRAGGLFGQTPQQTPQQPTSSDSHHYGRDAALAGGAGAAGLGAYAAARDRGDPSQQSTSRDTPSLASPTQQSETWPLAQTLTPQHVTGDPVTGATEPQRDHHYGRDAALAGGAGAAGYGAYEYSKGRGDTDPSVASPQSRGSTTGAYSQPSTRESLTSDSSSPQSEKKHHYGRDAALAGGAGAAGYGAYEYSKNRGSADPSAMDRDPYDNYKDAADPKVPRDSTSHTTSTTTTTTTGPHKSESANKADPRVHSSAYTAPQSQQQEQHYGRDAALAGGAGAAGAAGYSALQNDRGDTGPASKTIGPHESNVANVLDPRVRPEPEKMKEHTTAGPWQSDTLNKLDPKVESDPNKADVKAHGYASGVATQPQQLKQQQQYEQSREQDKDHHYGRDAAVVGGTGAAAYGGKQMYDEREQKKLAKEQEKQQEQAREQEGKEHHYGRDAAAVGGAGAAAYGGKQLYDEHEQEKLAKEQEKLAKEQDKQAQHEAKERAKEQEKKAKEQEKQAKHDAEKQQKQAKHDADEAAKAQKKEQEKAAKEHAKEQEKAEKEHAKEQEKLEKQRTKEQEKLEKEKAKEQEKMAKERSKEEEKKEKERAKEQEKLEMEKAKEDEKLAAAREDEATKKHNKLHKDAPEEREDKGGILHRIFHHKHHEREGAEGSAAGQSGSFDDADRPKGLDYKDADEARNASNLQALEGERGVGESSGYGQQGIGSEGLGGGDGIVTEKHTGLPMNVGQYGSGAGGTDAGSHIQGYHAK